ncbi:hypothetical protein EH164_04420 [Kosakonia sp. CCTCC M2018092]|nr:hypothetical protein EH164_04420 [Kosakonia sp. CCTCC M2018092]
MPDGGSRLIRPTKLSTGSVCVGLISAAPSGVNLLHCRMAALPYPAYKAFKRFGLRRPDKRSAIRH